MTENGVKFLETVSKNDVLSKALANANKEALSALSPDAKPEDIARASVSAALSVAKANGYSLTEEDFASPAMSELSEDELAAVSGGMNFNPQAVTSVCRCNGYGSGLTWELSCTCNGNGEGFNTNNGHQRCWCVPEGGLGMA